MLGAIYGDILGSLYEEIPRHPRRTIEEPTDDSFLTCACKEWVELFTTKEYSEFFISGRYQDFFFEEAIKSLKRWWSYFPEKGFSSGFNTWAKSNDFIQGTRNTNGCIMRNSPIVDALLKHSIYLRHDIISIAQLYASPTHNHPDSMEAVALHTEMIFLGRVNDLKKNDLKKILTQNNNPNFIYKPLSFWREKHKFIWDAPSSLAIAVASVMEADSYIETINNCISVGMDTDTYAAIAGPIAETLWGIDNETDKKCKKILNDYPQIKSIYSL